MGPEEFFKNHLQQSFDLACINKSRLENDVLSIDGMCGIKTRHFYNNIANFDECRYLEIGVWKGGSICAAMQNNKSTFTCIDDWCKFGGPKDKFLTNFEKYRGNNTATFIEGDCFLLDRSKLGKFNVYMYDGSHTMNHQYMAIDHFYYNLDDCFIYIVDDWNRESVVEGTKKVIKDRNLEVVHTIQIFSPVDETITKPDWRDVFDKENWWNGFAAFVLKKEFSSGE